MRHDGRQKNQLREIAINTDFLSNVPSVLISMGNTRVLCAATVVESVPPFLVGSGKGWLTAEYSMLPAATPSRNRRERFKISGRTQEIQRLIGRSLRAIIDLHKLGERTITIDCDVIEADGGTRTASITGGYIALALAIQKFMKNGILKANPLKGKCAAISVGIVNGKPILDLCYREDVKADVDMNVVMMDNNKFIEIQGTGEESVFSYNQLQEMLSLAQKGINELFENQEKTLTK
ncbi:ribonuclease PH [Clostridium sp. 'deep sea']|uniref:ribonuclease PH n=1 Tax=Clostridium sp. 'deep sea' TaxID=2779445 RepID=UPI0018965295|nr:ribonuclease PH [Clostridium sp. 'deep sea']QOR36948.1 ribonuclease PH [Clostridium sp. 'deep sea']